MVGKAFVSAPDLSRSHSGSRFLGASPNNFTDFSIIYYNIGRQMIIKGEVQILLDPQLPGPPKGANQVFLQNISDIFRNTFSKAEVSEKIDISNSFQRSRIFVKVFWGFVKFIIYLHLSDFKG